MAQEPGLPLGRARGPHLDLPGELSLTLHTHSLTPTHSSLPSTSTSGPLHMAVLPCGASYPFKSFSLCPNVTWEGPSLCTMKEAPPRALVSRPLPGPYHTQSRCSLPDPGLLACRTDAEPAS